MILIQGKGVSSGVAAGPLRFYRRGDAEGNRFTEPVILAADDLAPSETIQLDKSMILGFVTGGGSDTCHTAILSRSMDIPAVIGAGEQLKPEYEGREIIIDGEAGNAVVDADAETKARLTARMNELKKKREALEKLRGLPDVTLDGQGIRIYCNIGGPDDVPSVLKNDAGGIGMLRSEFLYLSVDDYPSEEMQFEAYRKVLADMKGKQVIIRTMDIGADKQIGYFNLPREENPAMGYRALRICLDQPELFRTQLRAMYRASVYGRMGIMFPMVTSVWEVREAKAMCEQVKRELAAEGIPYSEDIETGIMIETPAAVMISDLLAKEVDFFSCGTNDLIQYMLACDRLNADLARYWKPDHLSVLRALRLVCDNAHRHGTWVGICGELGADPDMIETFLAIGADEVSVSPRAVLPLRRKIRETDMSKVREKILKDLSSGEYQSGKKD